MEQIALVNVTIDTITFQGKISKSAEGYELRIGLETYPIVAQNNVEAFSEGMTQMGEKLKLFTFPIALGDKA